MLLNKGKKIVAASVDDALATVLQQGKEFSFIVIVYDHLLTGTEYNEFYIGTFRHHKYMRVKINASDVKLCEDEHLVIEQNQQGILTYHPTPSLWQNPCAKSTLPAITGV